jgi:hypothetical protein
MTAIASAHGADQLGSPGALTDRYSAAFLGAAGVAVAGGLIAALLLRFPKSPAGHDAAADDDRELVAA